MKMAKWVSVGMINVEKLAAKEAKCFSAARPS
jgi:hypothetical protein